MAQAKWKHLLLILMVSIGSYALGLVTADYVLDKKIEKIDAQIATFKESAGDIQKWSLLVQTRKAEENIELLKRLIEAAERGQSVDSVIAGYRARLQDAIDDLRFEKQQCEEFGVEWTAENTLDEAKKLISHVDFYYGGKPSHNQ